MLSDVLVRPRVSSRQAAAAAIHRVRRSFWAAAEAGLAAAVAWFVAHTLLGHPQPFFAPIAAVVALSTARFGRTRRTIQMVGGVLLGIGLAELLSALLGTTTVALGATVLITLLVAVFLGGGLLSEGMMFVNQAAASAILVVTLHRHGTGAERAVDALVGGATAWVVGVILFPAAPLPRLWSAERAVLEALAEALRRVSDLLARGEAPAPEWTLGVGYMIHDRLADLARARAQALENVRIAPRRWSQRARVRAADQRVSRVDLLANATLSLVRATVATVEDRPLPPALSEQVLALTAAIERLAQTPQPWPKATVDAITAEAHQVVVASAGGPVDPVPTVSAILRAAARDLISVTEPSGRMAAR